MEQSNPPALVRLSEGLGPNAKTVADHIEQRLRTWRQRQMSRSGDRLALDDFMGADSIDDLVDFVCDEYALGAVVHAAPERCAAVARALAAKNEAESRELKAAQELDEAITMLHNFADLCTEFCDHTPDSFNRQVMLLGNAARLLLNARTATPATEER